MKSYETNAYVKNNKKARATIKSSASQTIRISAGTLRGREIATPATSATHPMGSRERLALFNSISDSLPGAVVLDAFAGSGALGFEAISRGAAHVTFIEKNRKAIKAIQSNIANLNLSAQARLYPTKVEAMSFCAPFDIVIADPPYEFFTTFSGAPSKSAIEILKRLAASTGKLFILSHPAEFDPHSIDAPLLSTRSYAAARISTFGPNKH